MLQSIIIKRLKVDNPFVLLVTIGVFSLITSCGHQKRIHANQVDKIVFYAVAKGIDRCHSMSWEEVMHEGRDTVITDRDFIVRGYNFPAFVHPFSKVAGESVEPYEVVVFYDSPSWIDVSMLSEDEAYRLLGKDLICIIQEQPEALSIEETFIKGENGERRSMGISARSWIKRKSL